MKQILKFAAKEKTCPKQTQTHTNVSSVNPVLLSKPPRSCGDINGDTWAANPYKSTSIYISPFIYQITHEHEYTPWAIKNVPPRKVKPI